MQKRERDETKLHGCDACVTKSLSWMTYKWVTVHTARKLIQTHRDTKTASLQPLAATLRHIECRKPVKLHNITKA